MLRTSFSLWIALSLSLGLFACGGSSKATAHACAVPTGYDCCDGDQLGEPVCGGAGNAFVSCSDGTRLTPSNECTLPAPTPQTCSLPTGFLCCDGDVVWPSACASDGGAVCGAGGVLTPATECITPPPRPQCVLPAGYSCCDGDVEGTLVCQPDAGPGCSVGTTLTPTSECTIARPIADAG